MNTRKLKKYKKINFGSGHDKREGYLNIDVDAACKPDLLIVDNDLSAIPKNHFEEILANDVLEHIPRSESLNALLTWSEFLKPKGKLHVQTSSILGVAEQLKKNNNFEAHYGWSICLFGNQAHPGDFHHTGFTEKTLKVHLLAAGFTIKKFQQKDLWLFHVDCIKSEDWVGFLEDNKDVSNEDFTEKLFNYCFQRKPDELGGLHIIQGLSSGSLTRYDALKHLMSSSERLFVTAKKHNL